MDLPSPLPQLAGPCACTVAIHVPKPPKTFQGWNLIGIRETGARHFMETSLQPKDAKMRLNRISNLKHTVCWKGAEKCTLS